MDAHAVAAFEARAAQAEQRLAALESKLGGGAAGGVVDTSRYVVELQGLRDVLVAAKVQQDALEKRVAELETENSKLKYQSLHLKRAVTEADEKLAALQDGKQ